MSANVAINFVVDVIRALDNAIVQIVKSANVTEAAVTTRAVNNFTATPGAGVLVNRGDRIRVRIFGDDAGTMASTFSFSIGVDGTSAAVDGDTYVTFTETFAFEGEIAQGSGTTSLAVQGEVGANGEAGQSFTVVAGSEVLTEVKVSLAKTGAPADNLVIELQSSSAGLPTGSVVSAIATQSAAALTTTQTWYTYTLASPATLTAGTMYCIVLRRSGARDTSNFCQCYRSATDLYSGGTILSTSSGTWTTASFDSVFSAKFSPGGSTLYLTDTVSDVATAAVDREAWTSRGAGVVDDVTNTAAGWAAPIQITDTAGGTVAEWYTKPLQAFTLTGMAQANLRALESNSVADASLRAEIARVNGDGTSPTVWASWCISANNARLGELNTAEAAETANISGDDLAISDGQRLRFRVYVDDHPNVPLGTGHTVTFFYNGTSAGASGDSYVILPQSVLEFVAEESIAIRSQHLDYDYSR